MKAVFMGTPDFAVPVLETMYRNGIGIAAVYTQPDRPKGRKKTPAMSPVKEAALDLGLKVLQPERLRDPAVTAELAAIAPDVIVVAAFGQILPKAVLDIPPMGCINVHASLLPDYRGAAPIQQSILDGRSETGVTIMRMDEGLDTGDILLQKKIPIAADETGGSLFDRLSALGAEALMEALAGIRAGTIAPVPQPAGGSYAGMLTKDMGRMDFSMPAAVLERRVRGLFPWPGAFTERGGKRLKITGAAVAEGSAPQGTAVRVSKNGFGIGTGDGILMVTRLQPEGKKEMSAAEYLRGYPLEEGFRFGI